jgi:N-dimethylarginine dimethylaminohydrolase
MIEPCISQQGISEVGSPVHRHGASHRFLMCGPKYFDVTYVINPWMAGSIRRINRAQAGLQWAALHRLIQTVAEVELIDPEPELPDMPFTANAGLVVGDRAILSNFRHVERRAEEIHFERWFSEHRFHVHKLPRPILFEGAGDALLDQDRSCIWMGYGQRSAREAGTYIERWSDLEVILLELTDPWFYHLDTCFCPLAGGYVLYYPYAFSAASRAFLESRIPSEKIIAVGEEDAKQFACNAINIDDIIILNNASGPLLATLSRAGFRVRRSPLSEFLMAGGASKCLTLRLEEAVRHL